MKNKLVKQLILLICLNVQAGVAMAEETYHCPEKISVNSTIVHIPDDLEAHNSSTHHFLVSATFSDGHPSRQAFLRPSRMIENPDSQTAIETAVYDLSNLSNERAWLVCRYGNTPAILTKSLSKPYFVCRVSVSKDLGTKSGL